MLQVVEGVDHRDLRAGRQGPHRLVAEGPVRDPRDVAGEDAGRVLDGLPAPELQVLGAEVEGLAAELDHGDLEGDPGAGARFLEEEGEGPARQIGRDEAHALLGPGDAGVD